MNKELKVLSGFVLGAIAGGAVGLLLAPASGQKTRNKLKSESRRLMNEARNTLSDVADEAVAKVNEGLQDVSRKSQQAIAKSREKIEN